MPNTLATAMILATALVRPMERVSTMDPLKAQSIYDSHASGLVYETPLRVDYKARPYRLAPGCCELPEVRDSGRTYVFSERQPGAAAQIAEARDESPFISVEDLKNRGKAGSAVIDILRSHGALEGLTETNQISMF